MAKGHKAAGQDATFTIKVSKVKPGSSYTLEIMKSTDGTVSTVKTLSGAWKDGKETKDGVPIEIAGGKAVVVWKAEGPPADGEQRACRAFAQITYEDAKGKQKKEKSQELEVYNDWVEVEAVAKEDGAAVKNASFKVLVNKRPLDKKAKTDDSGKQKVEQLPPGPVTIQWEKPYKLSKVLEQKGTKLKAELEPAKRVKLLSHKGTSANRPLKQWVNLPEDAKAPIQGSKVKIKLKLENGKAGDKLYVKQSFGAANSKRNDVKVGLVGAEVKPWADKGGLEVDVDAKGEATVEVELGKAGGDVVVIEAGGTDRCKDISPVFLQAWRKCYYQISAPEGLTLPNLADLNAALQDACIVYEEVVKDRQVIKETDPGMPAGSWFDAKHFGSAAQGKRFLVIGSQNRQWFHDTYFKKSKAPLQVHIMFAHYVMDHVGPEGPIEAQVGHLNVAPMIGYMGLIEFQAFVFRYSLKTGNDALMKGSWEEVGGSNKGEITWDQLVVTDAPDTQVIGFKVPEAAHAHIKSGKHVKFSLRMVTTTGTYPAYSNGKDFQLISMCEPAPGAKPAGDKAINILLIHELGHNLKQVVGDQPEGRIPPGMQESDHGFNYANAGWHCAYGLAPDVFRRLKATTNSAGLRNQYAPRCVMYGQLLDYARPNMDPKFCVKCLPFVKARAVESFS